MELSTAIHLIEKGVLRSRQPQHWVDLGAGDGLFTRALATAIPNGGSIKAVDKNSLSLKSIQWNTKNVTLTIHEDDFLSLTWGENFHGIQIANALHYVRDQRDFLTKLKVKLSPSGHLLIVEYERLQPNPWVPYPITFGKLQELGTAAGFSSIEKLEQTDSIYDRATIYSACLIR